MDFILDLIKTFVGGVGMAGVISFIFAMVKKGKFESWGIKIGQWSSKFGRSRLGKGRWEKMEDLIFMSIVSFATGLKKGADLDDNNKVGNGET